MRLCLTVGVTKQYLREAALNAPVGHSQIIFLITNFSNMNRKNFTIVTSQNLEKPTPKILVPTLVLILAQLVVLAVAFL